MAKGRWDRPRVGDFHIVEWFEGAPIGLSDTTSAVRSVYNPATRQYEEISLPELQQPIRQGQDRRGRLGAA